MEQQSAKGKTTEAKKRRRSEVDSDRTAVTKTTTTNIPLTRHYEVSYMHRRVITAVVTSSTHGMILSASDDGVVKFWKRLGVTDSAATFNGSGSTAGGAGGSGGGVWDRCMEFVKSYTAHVGPVSSLAMNRSGDVAASVGAEDSTIKLYGVATFDAMGMIRNRDYSFGRRSCFLGEDQSLLAVSASASNSGNIHVFSVTTLSPKPLTTLKLHAAPVTAWAYNPVHQCVLSADMAGILELWDCTLLRPTSTPTTNNNTSLDIDNNDDVVHVGNETAAESSSIVVGSPPTTKRNGITWTSKHADTSFYELVKKKTYAIDMATTPKGHVYAIYGRDRRIRILDHQSGQLLVTFDERLKVYDAALSRRQQQQQSLSNMPDKDAKRTTTNYNGMDAVEYGKRAATERELDETPLTTGGLLHADTVLNVDKSGYQIQNISFDHDTGGQYLLVPTMVGIKIIDWNRRRVLAVVGQADASTLRFVHLCYCPPDAKLNRQMILARSAAASSSMQTTSLSNPSVNNDDDNSEGDDNNGDTKKKRKGAPRDKSDALLVALAYGKRRLYVFSHTDPLIHEDDNNDENNKEPDDVGIVDRDVFNEPPDAEDLLAAGTTGAGGIHAMDHSGAAAADQDSGLGSEAILRTSLGDIHIRLFRNEVPRTIENFCTHARSGYYNNVLFHRIIKGFMIQTGDPLGDGTGGESIWGGEFEDEFIRDLRHDRPFTVSMANAGPNTNGSQFFITTVPTPWLDNKHTVFGRVIRGMDICSAIENVKTDDTDKPLEDVRIVSIDIQS